MSKIKLMMLILTFITSTLNGQELIESNLEAKISLAGQLVLATNIVENTGMSRELILVDTQTLSQKLIWHSNYVLSPIFSFTGNTIVAAAYEGLGAYHLTESLINWLSTDSNLLYSPLSLSPDDQMMLATQREILQSTETLGLFDLQTLSFTPLFTLTTDQVITILPDNILPIERERLVFEGFTLAEWNPIYLEWILIRIDASVTTDENENQAWQPITFLYNLQTTATLSLDALFNEPISFGSIAWSDDGRSILLPLERTGFGSDEAIVAFDPQNAVTPLQVVERADSGVDVFVDWLGAGNLLLMLQGSTGSNNDIVYLIAEIVDEQYYSTEFVRLPSETFLNVGDSDWHITASDEEKRQLTCLFDQTLPAQLEINAAGRVTLGGTSSRLRDDHSTRANIITQMSPGTSFTVVGLPHCEDGYRWWQIQLENGTVGWAAEASISEYFLEPLTVIVATPTPTDTPTATHTQTPVQISPLRLTSMCSPDPASVRVWRVRNPNAVQVLITWQVVGTQQASSLIVPASSDAFFETVTVPGPNTTRIFLNGVQQDVKASGTTQCS